MNEETYKFIYDTLDFLERNKHLTEDEETKLRDCLDSLYDGSYKK